MAGNTKGEKTVVCFCKESSGPTEYEKLRRSLKGNREFLRAHTEMEIAEALHGEINAQGVLPRQFADIVGWGKSMGFLTEDKAPSLKLVADILWVLGCELRVSVVKQDESFARPELLT